MSKHYPILLVVIPLLFAFVISAVNWFRSQWCFPIAVGALCATFYSCAGVLLRVLDEGAVLYRVGGWAPPVGISYHIDHLNGFVLVIVAAAALLNLVACKRTVERDLPGKIGPFYTLYLLHVAGLLGIVSTGDVFNLFVFLEIAALTSYGLMAMGNERSAHATLNYLYLGTIGALFYLIGVGYLYIKTGSLSMLDIARILPAEYTSKTVKAAFAFCMVGIWVKMAFFPLHSWLPNAYSNAPAAARGLVAPLMTRVMAYVMIRLAVTLFSPAFSLYTLHVADFVVWVATGAIFFGTVYALAQRDLKRMLCYVMVSETGYIVGGAWLGNADGMTGAILHIANDSFMTLCLFLAIGNVVFKVGGCAFPDLNRLFRRMPFTMAGFVAGALSIIGVPPTCGFFSKWYLLTGAVSTGRHWFVAAIIFNTLASVGIFFRAIEVAYFRGQDSRSKVADSTMDVFDEAPASMVAPLLVASAALVIMGLYSGDIVRNIVKFAVPRVFFV